MIKREPKLFRVSAAAHELGLHPITVRRWIKAGRIQAVPMGREVRVPRGFGRAARRQSRWATPGALRARERAWAKGRPGDATRTTANVGGNRAPWCGNAGALRDCGSGLKATRRQLQRLLKLVCEDSVGEIAITYEDRLTRFGQEYLQTLFGCFGVTLTVLEPGEERTPEQELTDDLLALIASFSGRLYGMRSHKQQALVACAKQVIAEQKG